MGNVKKEIVKKLTKKQVFILTALTILCGTAVIMLMAFVSPEALPYLFGIF